MRDCVCKLSHTTPSHCVQRSLRVDSRSKKKKGSNKRIANHSQRDHWQYRVLFEGKLEGISQVLFSLDLNGSPYICVETNAIAERAMRSEKRDICGAIAVRSG